MHNFQHNNINQKDAFALFLSFFLCFLLFTFWIFKFSIPFYSRNLIPFHSLLYLAFVYFLGCNYSDSLYIQHSCTLRFILERLYGWTPQNEKTLERFVCWERRASGIILKNIFLNSSQPCACICSYVSLMWNQHYWSL